MNVGMVVFGLKDKYMAAPIEYVKEILKLDKITRLPNAPEIVKGLMNVRGILLPVVDGRKLFQVGEDEISEEQKKQMRILWISTGREDEEDIGILVDHILGILFVDDEELKEVPEGMEGAEKFKASLLWDDKFVLMIDIDNLLRGRGDVR